MPLVAALREQTERFDFNSCVFAKCVDALPENKLAQHYMTYNGIMGRECMDFHDAMLKAQSAAAVYFESPSFNSVFITMGMYQAKRELTEEWAEPARELATKYLRRLHDPEA